MNLSHTALPTIGLAAALLVAAALHAHALYCLALLVCGTVRARRRTPARTDSMPLRIAAIVAAHDEEAVIGRSVHSLVAQNYPSDRFGVFVVADRCSDATASRAREAGAHVIERAHGAPGKSEALRYGLERVLAQGEFDAIAVFDADNIADAGFLAAAAHRLSDGEQVVQGLVDSTNPDVSWVAASSALGFYAIAAVAQAPREALRLSVPLMGTAWAAKVDVFRRFVPQLRSLADDLELASLLAEAGIRAAYEPAARVLDEKPARLRIAVQQRHRWMQGRWAVAVRHLAALLTLPRRGGAPVALGERFRAVDVAVQLVGPSLLFSAVVLAIVSATALVLEVLTGARAIPHFARPSLYLAAAYYIAPALAIRRLSPPSKVWTFYLVQPLYILLSIPLAISGFVTRGAMLWRRTAHTGN